MVYLGGGGGEYKTALRDDRIRERERVKVLEELWKFCLINGAEEHGDLIGLPKDPFFPLKLIKKIAEMRYVSIRQKER